MDIEESLVNSKGEEINYFDEFYDLEPVLAEIFSSDYDLPQESNPTIGSQIIQEISTTKPSSSSSSNSDSCSQVISFGNSSPITEKLQGIFSRESSASPQIINFSYFSTTTAKGPKGHCNMNRSPLQAKDHVMAERRRREKISQLFITLSKLVPGLKKLDKASILGDAVKYLQELQNRVRILEEEANSTNTSSFSSSCQARSINGGLGDISVLPAEIKARILNCKNVLIKISHKKQKGLISRIQHEIEKLQLNVVDIRAIPFGASTLDITILAEMDGGFCGTVEKITEHLEMALIC